MFALHNFKEQQLNEEHSEKGWLTCLENVQLRIFHHKDVAYAVREKRVGRAHARTHYTFALSLSTSISSD